MLSPPVVLIVSSGMTGVSFSPGIRLCFVFGEWEWEMQSLSAVTLEQPPRVCYRGVSAHMELQNPQIPTVSFFYDSNIQPIISAVNEDFLS